MAFWYFILSAFSSLRKSSLPLLIFVLGYFNHSCEWGPFDHLSSVRLEVVAFCETSSSFMKTATVSHGKDMQIFISAPVFGIKYNCQTLDEERSKLVLVTMISLQGIGLDGLERSLPIQSVLWLQVLSLFSVLQLSYIVAVFSCAVFVWTPSTWVLKLWSYFAKSFVTKIIETNTIS